jgi:hypothetical protein
VTGVDFEPLSVVAPLWEVLPGVFRVGNSRVLLELVLRANQPYLRWNALRDSQSILATQVDMRFAAYESSVRLLRLELAKISPLFHDPS